MSILIKRQGGLGNQLFQVACAYALSKETNKKLFISLNTNDNSFSNSFRKNFNKTIFKNFNKTIETNEFIYLEKTFNYSLIDYNFENITLIGYFQSLEYFKKYSNEIRDLFLSSLEKYSFLLDKNIFKNSISIHIRRTDYLYLQHIHPCCPIYYYIDALNKLNYKDKTIIIFSDDLNWCKNNKFFKDIENKIFFESKTENDEINSLVDLYAMSLCEDNIIANSSFSWWASFLNSNQNKKIIAPKLWFGNKPFEEYSGIYTKDMIIL